MRVLESKVRNRRVAGQASACLVEVVLAGLVSPSTLPPLRELATLDALARVSSLGSSEPTDRPADGYAALGKVGRSVMAGGVSRPLCIGALIVRDEAESLLDGAEAVLFMTGNCSDTRLMEEYVRLAIVPKRDDAGDWGVKGSVEGDEPEDREREVSAGGVVGDRGGIDGGRDAP